jgi:phospholipid transport system substrate-binding protein
VFLVTLAIAIGTQTPCSSHAAANPVEAFVQQNVDRGYAILHDPSLSDQQRHTQFRGLMLSLTDTRRIGAFTLGQYANGVSKVNLDTFQSAFADYVVAVYESRLSKYTRQALKVTGSIERAVDDIIVNADVLSPNSPNGPVIKAAFRVRKTNDGRPIVTDIQAEGVWLALSERSEFTAFLQQHSGHMPDLISELRRQTQALIPTSFQ